MRWLGGSRFEFTRPDGTVIAHCPRDDSAESSPRADIESLNRAAGLDMETETFTSLWDGMPMDCDMAICALLADDSRLS